MVEQMNGANGALDLQDVFFKYTMDAFGKIAFNADFNTLQGEPNEYGMAFDGAHSSFMTFYQQNNLLCTLLELVPSTNLLRRGIEWGMLQTMPGLQDFYRHMAVLERYTSKVIRDRRACPKELVSSKVTNSSNQRAAL